MLSWPGAPAPVQVSRQAGVLVVEPGDLDPCSTNSWQKPTACARPCPSRAAAAAEALVRLGSGDQPELSRKGADAGLLLPERGAFGPPRGVGATPVPGRPPTAPFLEAALPAEVLGHQHREHRPIGRVAHVDRPAHGGEIEPLV